MRACPALMLCRNPKTLRASVTILKALEADAELDLRQVTWIDVGVLALMHHIAQRIGTAEVYLPINTATKDFVMSNITPAKGSSRYAFVAPTTFPIRYVETERDMKNELPVWRTMLVATANIPQRLARRYSSTMTEVLINSFTHGKTPQPCILGGQTYEKSGHSVLVAVDSGLGIPHTLRECGLYPGDREDWEWILMSLEDGVSAQTEPENRGSGLFLLVDQVRANGGSLLIVSGRGVVYLNRGGDPTGEPLGTKYEPFSGTLIVLDLRSGT